MSLLLSGLNPKYLEAIKKFRLIDDTFFNICFDGIAVDSNGKIYNVEIQRADEGAWCLQRL